MLVVIIILQEDSIPGTDNMARSKTDLALASWSLSPQLKELLFLKHLTWCLALGTPYIMILITIINGCQTPYGI